VSERPALSEDEERDERADRDELRRVESKIREMRSRREGLLNDVRALSADQKALYDQRAPRQAALEGLNAEHQSLGRELGDLRRHRDDARRRLDEALLRLREFRSLAPRGERAHPDQIRREIADLEMRQQTNALPLPEENQLILRVRELTKLVVEADRHQAEIAERQRHLKELEAGLTAARLEVDHLGNEMARAKMERERRMQSMRERLVDEGRLVAEIREKARARGLAMERLDAAHREVLQLEREADRLVGRLRSRRHEARQTVRDYNRTVRDNLAGPDAYARVAEAQLEELLKRGRVTLNG
jgi:uncharacterized coiled-coil DUF342 family protein